MINLVKSYDFFNPSTITDRVHIIGCGSVGSTLAENLVRCGVTKITLWDFDTVESHNVSNQMFRGIDIGKKKVDALRDILTEIDPEITETIELKSDGWNGKILSGYIFLAVDNIEIRKDFVQKHMNNPFVKAVFDFRTELTSAQHFAAAWNNPRAKESLWNSMQFTHDEAAASTPVSACGVTLGVATTVRLICALGVNNFITFIKEPAKMKNIVLVDGFNFAMESF